MYIRIILPSYVGIITYDYKDPVTSYPIVFQSYLVRIGVKGPPFTPPEAWPSQGVLSHLQTQGKGSFWKTRELDSRADMSVVSSHGLAVTRELDSKNRPYADFVFCPLLLLVKGVLSLQRLQHDFFSSGFFKQ